MDGKTKNLIGIVLEVLGFALLATAIVAAIEHPFIMISILLGAALVFTARMIRGTLKLNQNL